MLSRRTTPYSSQMIIVHKHQLESTDRLGLEYELEDPPGAGETHQRHY